MLYQILADITVAFHFAWILFLIFGALIGRRVKWVRLLHVGSLVFSVLLQLFSWICPLTHLEVWLRGKSGWTYTGNFIQHYVEKLVYLDVPREAVFIGTVVVVLGTGWIYWSGRKQ